MAERVTAFQAAYPQWPAAWPHLVQEQGRDVLYATWLIGQDYRNKTLYYGAYPHGYVARVLALFPAPVRTLRDGTPRPTLLHAFSGSLPPGPYVRLDANAAVSPDVVGSVYDAKKLFLGQRPFRLVLADPPYTKQHAFQYGLPMIDRRRALAALAEVTKPGGYLVWLDQVWPMHQKAQWVTVGRITVIRSTNHTVRLATIFERVDAGADARRGSQGLTSTVNADRATPPPPASSSSSSGLTCACGEPWGPGTAHPLCEAETLRACEAFDAAVAQGTYDAQGSTPAERKAQAKRQAARA